MESCLIRVPHANVQPAVCKSNHNAFVSCSTWQIDIFIISINDMRGVTTTLRDEIVDNLDLIDVLKSISTPYNGIEKLFYEQVVSQRHSEPAVIYPSPPPKTYEDRNPCPLCYPLTKCDTQKETPLLNACVYKFCLEPQ